MTTTINVTMKKSLYFVLFLSISVIIPFLFHLSGINGTVFIPIYIAVVIAALTLDPVSAVFLGIITPLANNILTGMPAHAPMPMLQMLIVELMVVTLIISLLRKTSINLLFIIPISLIIARLSSIIFVPFVNTLSIQSFLNQRLISLPGMVVCVVISFIYIVIHERRR
ncbi:MAG: hypothetical protein A2015_08765 [Spirochaetes bacterium GWF1_31_7]|nr:MAG: hypothetical protein A2Y30_06895 [Spirochaetes bacterium GWE1_32_154]OHD48012.1 MAG: hypothetical protein A2015_08765 [Spirochaetes bacterium GWF1_31_7]OHD49671.1 MAG: hypothetical protein A2Y29_06870 [Spirochaetes bacterium GWE2_31_10]OHD77100.1 MAG: hypothetical protein A2355_05410 [Spirochaetes bacterium RIFOXYB1_FULL_32_8]HBD92776.1 hypothetical protein [Spirochaetia bacterium]